MSDRKRFLLRMDPRLWRELQSWAEEEMRSVNAQIEFVLRDAVRRRGRPVQEEAETLAEQEPA
jgi:hypothetical protein